MHAALSVIVFTVLSGTGLGAVAIVALAGVCGAADGSGDAAHAWNIAAVVALSLVVAGFCASTLHLANPKNAWRSATRFRTSWLSREAVFAVLFIALAAGWVALRFCAPASALATVAGTLSALLAWIVIVCTAMIYASLKPIRAWHTWRVPLNYLLLAHAAGAVVILVVLRTPEGAPAWLPNLAAVLVGGAAIAKWDYRHYLASDTARVTLESALGVAQGVRPARAPATVAARLLDVGHSRGTFLTREFGMTPTSARRVAALWTMIAGVYALPLAWLASGSTGAIPGALVIVVLLAGLLAERWLFFVEARHTVRLYHGERRV